MSWFEGDIKITIMSEINFSAELWKWCKYDFSNYFYKNNY